MSGLRGKLSGIGGMDRPGCALQEVRTRVCLFGRAELITVRQNRKRIVASPEITLTSASCPPSDDCRSARVHHQTMLVMALLVIAAAFLLRRTGTNEITLVWPHVKLPPLCASRALFGVDCPGCGLTRSVVALAAGDVRESFRYHRLGWLFAITIVGQIPYRLYALRATRGGAVQQTWPNVFAYILFVALIVNWLFEASRG